MIGIYRQGMEIAYGVKQFICDTESDIANLPNKAPDASAGSTALIISASEVYILNNLGVWVKLKGAYIDGDGEIVIQGDDAGALRFF